MPITKSAQKKMRKDAERTERNRATKNHAKKVLAAARKAAGSADAATAARTAQSAVATAVKKGVFHKNKGARIVARLSAFLKKSASADQK